MADQRAVLQGDKELGFFPEEKGFYFSNSRACATRIRAPVAGLAWSSFTLVYMKYLYQEVKCCHQVR
jgi:hypothetical protein